MNHETYPIDFVLFWVDPGNKQWQQEKAEYRAKVFGDQKQEADLAIRYRDWDNLQYWFRGVEKYAPWVRKIFFVTWGAVPDWLDTTNPKLVIVNDREILPEGCAPVFSPNPKEINLHRIPDLSEHFVYFNDDMFLIRETDPTDFFLNGRPREMAVSYQLANDMDGDSFRHMLFTMMGVINSFFSKKEVQRRHWHQWYTLKYGAQVINTLRTRPFRYFSGIMIPHLPSPMRKSTYEEVWEKIPELLMETSSRRFRDPLDLTQYIFRYWAICKGEIEPANIYKYGKEYFMEDLALKELCETISRQKYKMICINDSRKITDFERCITLIQKSFETLLPERSSFEKEEADPR
ncbi:stealth conserved region 3 domain-containing protein [Aristaeella lactis]|uniref:Stealth protein CR4, conserved region 4 n=1 Tax=Aristaeella lactis TaxID=3046383 RepID=A0AC61PPI3_9FIRM|nr:stealth conserved region 3 domain-containing protein [Aristaeella lactis]QUA54402.1 hypothetical protein JYE50_07220 [Aristaeella lactis]SMC83235.1 Stealth protein CR4, conserved region 4 [Aristaeella lactis]